MRSLFIALCLTLAASAEIVDRIAITVGREVITELQLDEELRVTAFLNRHPIVRDLKMRRAAADRLVQQLLVRREMQVSRYPLPGEEDVNKYFEQIRGGFSSAAEFNQMLLAHGLTEDVLRGHLALQLTILRFIEYRFQPEIDISDAEIRAVYERDTASWNDKRSGAPPSFEASHESIRKALVEERIDRALDAWLQEGHRHVHIAYVDVSLQ